MMKTYVTKDGMTYRASGPVAESWIRRHRVWLQQIGFFREPAQPELALSGACDKPKR